MGAFYAVNAFVRTGSLQRGALSTPHSWDSLLPICSPWSTPMGIYPHTLLTFDLEET